MTFSVLDFRNLELSASPASATHPRPRVSAQYKRTVIFESPSRIYTDFAIFKRKIDPESGPLRDAPVVRRPDISDSPERPSSQTAERTTSREGMPSALMSDHGSMPGVLPSHQPREAVDVRRTPVAPRKEPAICPTDDEAQVPRKASKDKRSFDYVWRSGVAGGLAGCAVCDLPHAELLHIKIADTARRPKQLSRRSIGSRFSSSRTIRNS
jgi:hypothetical protein